jgi:transposase
MGCAKKRINPTVANHVNRNFTTDFTKAVIKAVHQLSPPWKTKQKGRKGHDPKTVAIGCLLKVGFNQTYDGIEAHIKDSETIKQHCPNIPGHSVIQRGMKRLSITYIRKVMNRVTRFLRRKKMNIAVDSTGFSTHNSSIWYDIRIKRNGKRKDCIKLHISIDIDTGVIHSFTTTPWNRHDSKEFEQLIKHLPELGNVLGDKALSSRNNCQLVSNKKGTPYLCFRKNSRSISKGYPAWIISFRAYKNDTEAWLSVYHLRSIIESVFSSIKKRWGSFLHSKKRWMQKKELALKVFSYNVKQVLMINYAKERKVPLWIHVE